MASEPERLSESELLSAEELAEQCRLGDKRYATKNWHMVIECRDSEPPAPRARRKRRT